MSESIKDQLSEACRKGYEIRLGFILTCCSVPFKERCSVASVEDSYVVIRNAEGNEDAINFYNIFEVMELNPLSDEPELC